MPKFNFPVRFRSGNDRPIDGRHEYLAHRSFIEAMPATKAMVRSAYFANSVGINACVPVGTAEAIGNTLCTFLEENPGIRDATGEELMTTLIAYKYRCPVP
nr:hypothetical protein [Rhizobium sp. L43]